MKTLAVVSVKSFVLVAVAIGLLLVYGLWCFASTLSACDKDDDYWMGC